MQIQMKMQMQKKRSRKKRNTHTHTHKAHAAHTERAPIFELWQMWPLAVMVNPEYWV